MKAISLWQPWATWVALGWKTIETRRHARFRRLVGQRVAIHAAKKWDPKWRDLAESFLSNEQLFSTINHEFMWPRGAIVCTVRVRAADWFDIGDPYYNYEEIARHALCAAEGRFLLWLEQIQAFKKPIPWKGRQGIFVGPHEL